MEGYVVKRGAKLISLSIRELPIEGAIYPTGRLLVFCRRRERGEEGAGRDIGSDEDTREAGMQMTERRARIVRRMQANVLPWLRHWDRALSSRPTIASVLDGGFVRTTHITNLTRRVAPTLLFFSSPVKGALANLEDARPFYP